MSKKKKLTSTPQTTSNNSNNSAPIEKNTEKIVVPAKPSVDLFEQSLGNKSIYLTLGLLGIIAFMVYGAFWFTDSVFLFKDIGSDTINVFYPTYYWNAATWEAEGSFPTWSFATGMGQDIMLGSKGDPFVWLLYWAGKDSIAGGLAYIEALKIVLSGLCFYAYMRTMQLSYFSAVSGGLIYAFSGFMIVGSGWYVFSIEGLYFAMMLWAFERFLVLGKWAMFPFVLMLVAILQPLDVYIMAILIGTYGTVRILEVNDFDYKDLFVKYAQLMGLGVLALAMGAFLFLPSIELMINSPRVLGESTFFDTLKSKSMFAMADADLWATTKARLFSSNLLVDNEFSFKGAMNFLEAPAIYCGLGTLLLVPQLFSFLNKKERILYGVLLSLYLLPLFFPFVRYSFWLFAGDYFRIYSLFVIFVLLFMSSKAIHFIYKEQRISWIGLGIGFLLAIYMLFSISDSGTNIVLVNESSRSFVGLLLVVNALVIAAWSMNAFRSTARIAFLVILCIDLISVARPTLNNRSIAKASEFTTEKVGYNDYTVDAVQHIQSIDQSKFYRIEKFGYHSGLAIHASTNDAKVQGYMGTKSYHSFNQLNYIRFLGALDVIDQKDENQTRWTPGVAQRQLLNMLASNKYMLTKTNPQQPIGVGYKFIKTFGDVSIFENQHFLPLGFTYDKMISRSDFNKLKKDKISKDITLLKAVVIEDEDLPRPAKLAKFDTLQVQPNLYSEEALTLDVQERTQEAFQIETFKNAHITGKITLTKDKMLFFSIPLDKGWSAKVNGKEARIQRVNIGFSGLMLPAGTHQIELIYNTPYASLGGWVSLVAFLVYGAIWGWFYKKGKAAEVETEGTEGEE